MLLICLFGTGIYSVISGREVISVFFQMMLTRL